jgi:hypothetical protein
MGKAIKSVTGIFKAKSAKLQGPTRSLYDISEETKGARANYAGLTDQTKATSQAGAASADVLKQMGQAALGRGPSLAEAQLKSAQDRNLAQQLAATQSSPAGSSALGQRAMLQNMGRAGQDMAQQAVQARLGERNDFMNQAGAANAAYQGAIGQQLDADLMNKRSMQGFDTQRTNVINQERTAKAASQNALTGALIGGGASILGAQLGKAEGGYVQKPKNYADGGFISSMEKTLAGLGSKIKDTSGKQYDIKDQKFLKTSSNSHKDGGFIDAMEKKLSGWGSKIKDTSGKGHQRPIEEQKFLKTPDNSGYKVRDKEEKHAEGGNVGTSKAVDKKEDEKTIKQKIGSGLKDAAKGIAAAYNNTPAYVPLERTTFESGGDVEGPGTATSDSIPAWLSDGEFVIKASEVKKPGILAHLEAINSGKVTKKHLKSLAEALQERNKKGK